MAEEEPKKSKRISVDLPIDLIERFDQLKSEWGLRARGAVLKRLLEVVLNDNEIKDINSIDTSQDIKDSSDIFSDDKALVLIKSDTIEIADNNDYQQKISSATNNKSSETQSNRIDLPGFVQTKAQNLRESLSQDNKTSHLDETVVLFMNENDIKDSLNSAYKHWISLYGQKPSEIVVEAAMTWLATDIWPRLDWTENLPFTWTLANKHMKQYLPSWNNSNPNFERVLVLAGVLEDPFGTTNLSQRMPSLIRRFVNRFKRTNQTTSFETLESTMTVHGALKLLDLPTTAGAALSLGLVREAFKQKALNLHPDAGGSNEAMRKLNEGYQLLKDLYK